MLFSCHLNKPQLCGCLRQLSGFGPARGTANGNYAATRKNAGNQAKIVGMAKKEDQGKDDDISSFCEMLKEFSLELLLFGMAKLENKGLEKNISRYITRWRKEKADINGHDLSRLGIKPGPIYSLLLKKALQAKLDGKAPNAKTQLSLVREIYKKARRQCKQCLPHRTIMYNMHQMKQLWAPWRIDYILGPKPDECVFAFQILPMAKSRRMTRKGLCFTAANTAL